MKRHRLNPRGNRQLNHALHVAAVTQVAHDTAGRAFYLRKIAEKKSPREAMRALKRRISDAVSSPARGRRQARDREDKQGRLESRVTGLTP
ncbi:MAG: IS110 family transposase [Actinomycetota bacterium]|nr:IS110 family transposase [Actinomycetota bacterium]MDQ3639989.1 IS110 family transposase [Actinomycetota bacterium]